MTLHTTDRAIEKRFYFKTPTGEEIFCRSKTKTYTHAFIGYSDRKGRWVIMNRIGRPDLIEQTRVRVCPAYHGVDPKTVTLAPLERQEPPPRMIPMLEGNAPEYAKC